MGFARQEYWSRLPFPSPEDLPDPGIKPGSPTLEADALRSEPPVIERYYYVQFRSVQFCCSVQSDSLRPMDWSMPGFPVYHQLPEFTQTHVHWVGDAIQPSHPLPLLLPPSIFPSIRVFLNESILHIRWPTYWSFSFSNSPSNEYSGLIFFRMDWLDFLAVQGTLQVFSNTTVQKH